MSIKNIFNRIKGIATIERLVSAMQFISLAKLSKLKKRINNTEVLCEKLMYLINNTLNITGIDKYSYFPLNYFFNSDIKTVLLVICTSDKGLCGGFNKMLFSMVEQDIYNFVKQGKLVKILCVGQKGYVFLCKKYKSMVLSFYSVNMYDVGFLSITIANKILSLFVKGVVDSCYIYFYKFENVIKKMCNKILLLPLSYEEGIFNVADVIYQGEDVLLNLITYYLNTRVIFILINNQASEESFRITAMGSASNNAKDMKKKMLFKLNFLRQSLITNELIEIVSGIT